MNEANVFGEDLVCSSPTQYALKTVARDGDLATVGAYGILWGHPEQTDFTKQYFAPETNFGARRFLGVDTLFHHSIPVKGLEEYAYELFPPVKAVDEDDDGLFVQTVLNLKEKHHRRLFGASEAGAFGYSTGANHRALRFRRVGAKSEFIEQWPGIEISYTFAPAEPRLWSTVAPVNTLMESETYQPEAMKAAIKCLTDTSFNLNVPLDLSSERSASGSTKTTLDSSGLTSYDRNAKVQLQGTENTLQNGASVCPQCGATLTQNDAKRDGEYSCSVCGHKWNVGEKSLKSLVGESENAVLKSAVKGMPDLADGYITASATRAALDELGRRALYLITDLIDPNYSFYPTTSSAADALPQPVKPGIDEKMQQVRKVLDDYAEIASRLIEVMARTSQDLSSVKTLLKPEPEADAFKAEFQSPDEVLLAVKSVLSRSMPLDWHLSAVRAANESLQERISALTDLRSSAKSASAEIAAPKRTPAADIRAQLLRDELAFREWEAQLDGVLPAQCSLKAES